MTAFIRQSSLSLLLLLCLLGHNSAFSHGEAKADWIHVGGNVDFEGIPLCALVLINGVSQFSCDGNGRYDMEVPVDANGMITVQVFADGFAPFNQIVIPDQAAAYPVAMVQDQGSPSLDVGAIYEPSATEGRLVVSGSITIGGAPVCALVLANGVSMFSCGGAGQYSLDVPLDSDGDVTLMVFAAGFKPYKVIADPDTLIPYNGSEILNYVVRGEGGYSDGSGQASYDSNVTLYIFGGFSSDVQPNPVFLQTSVQEGQGQSFTTNDYYFYDDTGNYVQLTAEVEATDYFVNIENNALGALTYPARLKVGNAWTNRPYRFRYDGELYSGSRAFTVLAKEVVSVPYGNVEAYKISFSQSGDRVGFGIGSVDMSGSAWIHPQIGLVKYQEAGEAGFYGYSYNYTYELTGINWDIE